jgi:hypothetical protein
VNWHTVSCAVLALLVCFEAASMVYRKRTAEALERIAGWLEEDDVAAVSDTVSGNQDPGADRGIAYR